MGDSERMKSTIHSLPDRCPKCGSEDIASIVKSSGEISEVVHCLKCDGSPYKQEFPVAIKADLSFLTCPHCKSVDGIEVRGGLELCTSCGLEPDRDDYSTRELASLWKKGSGIYRFMNRTKLSGNSAFLNFLITECGPHCSYARVCPQEVNNFTSCFKEEREGNTNSLLQIEEEGDILMGRGRRWNKRKKNKQKEREKAESLKPRIRYARVGWYADRIIHNGEDENTQRSAHTGGGS